MKKFREETMMGKERICSKQNSESLWKDVNYTQGGAGQCEGVMVPEQGQVTYIVIVDVSIWN